MSNSDGEEYSKEEMMKLNNPKHIGPGAWMTLHKIARYDDLNGQKFYPGFVKSFCEDFNCGSCRPHCIDNQIKDPPENYVGQKWGMSWHSFKFHNRANKALGKKIMSWKQYAKIYLNDDPEKGIVYCQEGCGDDPLEKEEKKERNEKNERNERNEKKGKKEAIDAKAFKELYAVSRKDPELARYRKKKKEDRSDGETLHIRKK